MVKRAFISIVASAMAVSCTAVSTASTESWCAPVYTEAPHEWIQDRRAETYIVNDDRVTEAVERLSSRSGFRISYRDAQMWSDEIAKAGRVHRYYYLVRAGIYAAPQATTQEINHRLAEGLRSILRNARSGAVSVYVAQMASRTAVESRSALVLGLDRPANALTSHCIAAE